MSARNILNLATRYKFVLTAYHAIYRAATSAFNINDLSTGIIRILHNTIKSDQTTLVIMQNNKAHFTKYTLQKHRKIDIKKGTKTVLNKQEKHILRSDRIIFKSRSIMIPLIFINNIGILSIKRSQLNTCFEEYDKELAVGLSEEISIILRNYQLYEEQQRTVIGAVRALTKFLDRHAPTSHIDLKCFSIIMKEIAKQLSLKETQIVALEYAAMLHDAGKVEIPNDILLKKNQPLTKEELSIIKNHPIKGAEILKDLKMLKPVMPIILNHHEKYDGSGYPSGLKKNQIPIEARIMSVIDAFDAMIFGRPYKERMTLKEAIEEIKKHKGTQFDPKIVDIFLKVIMKKHIKMHLLKKIKQV